MSFTSRGLPRLPSLPGAGEQAERRLRGFRRPPSIPANGIIFTCMLLHQLSSDNLIRELLTILRSTHLFALLLVCAAVCEADDARFGREVSPKTGIIFEHGPLSTLCSAAVSFDTCFVIVSKVIHSRKYIQRDSSDSCNDAFGSVFFCLQYINPRTRNYMRLCVGCSKVCPESVAKHVRNIIMQFL